MAGPGCRLVTSPSFVPLNKSCIRAHFLEDATDDELETYVRDTLTDDVHVVIIEAGPKDRPGLVAALCDFECQRGTGDESDLFYVFSQAHRGNGC